MRLTPCLAADWSAETSGLHGLSLLQTPEYLAAKVASGVWRGELHTINDENGVRGAVVVLIRDLPLGLGGLAWINRGPLFRDPADLGALLDAVKAHFTKQGYYLRVALPLEDTVACSLTPTSALGWASTKLDLAPDEDTLRGNLKQKWRNGLNKAIKLGLSVRDGAFDLLLEDYAAFLKSRGFATTVTPDLLVDLKNAGADLTAYVCEQDGALLGTALMVRYGDTMEYLVGNSSDDGRKKSAGQLLLWTAALRAKEAGCTTFDVGGLDPERTPDGIRRFKEGLGGTPYRLTPALEALPWGVKNLTARLVRAKVEGATQ